MTDSAEKAFASSKQSNRFATSEFHLPMLHELLKKLRLLNILGKDKSEHHLYTELEEGPKNTQFLSYVKLIRNEYAKWTSLLSSSSSSSLAQLNTTSTQEFDASVGPYLSQTGAEFIEKPTPGDFVKNIIFLDHMAASLMGVRKVGYSKSADPSFYLTKFDVSNKNKLSASVIKTSENYGISVAEKGGLAKFLQALNQSLQQDPKQLKQTKLRPIFAPGTFNDAHQEKLKGLSKKMHEDYSQRRNLMLVRLDNFLKGSTTAHKDNKQLEEVIKKINSDIGEVGPQRLYDSFDINSASRFLIEEQLQKTSSAYFVNQAESTVRQVVVEVKPEEVGTAAKMRGKKFNKRNAKNKDRSRANEEKTTSLPQPSSIRRDDKGSASETSSAEHSTDEKSADEDAAAENEEAQKDYLLKGGDPEAKLEKRSAAGRGQKQKKRQERRQRKNKQGNTEEHNNDDNKEDTGNPALDNNVVKGKKDKLAMAMLQASEVADLQLRSQTSTAAPAEVEETGEWQTQTKKKGGKRR